MTVEPDTFAGEMTKHWEAAPLSNASSDALRKAWANMARTFNNHITGNTKNQWSILQLPTGTGKTQGLALYCSMLPKNRKKHPGVLIVTDLTDEALTLADLINSLSGNPETALVCHKDNKNEVAEKLSSVPVLVITHVAYKMAWHDAERDELYTRWQGGKRKLTVIDEALDIVNHAKVTIDELRFLRAIIPQKVASQRPKEMAVIDEAHALVSRLTENTAAIESYELHRFDSFALSGDWDFDGLISDIAALLPGGFIPGEYDASTVQSLRAGLIGKCKRLFSSLQKVVSDWCLCSRNGDYYLLSTARFLLPTDIKSAVVLDATASENPTAIMLKTSEVLKLHELPKKIKRYENVRLYVSYNHNVSKSYLKAQNKGHFDAMLNGVLPRIADRKKTLICTHKDTEDHFEGLDEKKFCTAHWYAINGLNTFRDCDTVIIYGLPYLGPAMSGSALIAFLHWLHGIEGTEYPVEETAEIIKKHATDYALRHIIVSVVQAINRVHCRKITEIKNGEGHCPQTDVYLYLNKKETKAGEASDGEKIIRAIKRLMPGVDVIEWDAPRQNEDEGEYRFSENEQAIIKFFDAAKAGRHEYATVQEKTLLSKREMERHSPKLSKKNGGTPLSDRLPQVTYYSTKGPGAEKYFRKETKKKTA